MRKQNRRDRNEAKEADQGRKRKGAPVEDLPVPKPFLQWTTYTGRGREKRGPERAMRILRV
jgi:hypothetical protein